MVFVFARTGDTWEERGVLVTDETVDTAFGLSVAASADFMAAGSSPDEIFRLYHKPTDSPIVNEDAHDGEVGQLFGTDLGLIGPVLVVGAPGADYTEGEDEIANTGAAIVFRREGAGSWPVDGFLLAPTPGANQNLGYSVDIQNIAGGQRVAAGAPGINTVFTFEDTGDGWVHGQEIARPEANSFGRAVHLHSPFLTVGALNSVWLLRHNTLAGYRADSFTSLGPPEGASEDGSFGVQTERNSNWLVILGDSDDLVYVFPQSALE